MSKSKRGFASMDPAKQRAIATRGGKAAQANGNAHLFTTVDAKAAGVKGAAALKQKLGAAAFTARMAELGRRGGRNGAMKRRLSRVEPRPESSDQIVDASQAY